MRGTFVRVDRHVCRYFVVVVVGVDDVMALVSVDVIRFVRVVFGVAVSSAVF